ncbi:PREDICTED: uncharacterized protein LOC106808466 [Priapulus caudatus]|uniref:Uncharacterized protein LOC106808466 n=1 Tax=Priapulus caudatus TaxID=37621 RepID=A0ABM1E3B5_PRICU|nr:PREDICTED: uncharacterized protein LOC106808466 [Priapulus caudatus]
MESVGKVTRSSSRKKNASSAVDSVVKVDSATPKLPSSRTKITKKRKQDADSTIDSPGTSRTKSLKKKCEPTAFKRGRKSLVPSLSPTDAIYDTKNDNRPKVKKMKELHHTALQHALDKMENDLGADANVEKMLVLAREAFENASKKIHAQGLFIKAVEYTASRVPTLSRDLQGQQEGSDYKEYTKKLAVESDKWDSLLNEHKELADKAREALVQEHMPSSNPPEKLEQDQTWILDGRPDYAAMLQQLKHNRGKLAIHVEQVCKDVNTLHRFQEHTEGYVSGLVAQFHNTSFKDIAAVVNPKTLIEKLCK